MKIKELIHKGSDVYENFETDKYYDPQIETHVKNRYGEVMPSFNHALGLVKEPKILVEVGTYQGASAIFFGKEFKRRNIECDIVCIDTFVGSITHWVQDYFYKDLKQENGFPTLYKQFLAAVKKNGLEKQITPLPLTSLDGARFLVAKNIQPDLIYVDASHEYPDVMLDLLEYYKALKSGGVIFGDDYDGWEGVRKSVNQFCAELDIKLEVYGGKWFIQKK